MAAREVSHSLVGLSGFSGPELFVEVLSVGSVR